MIQYQRRQQILKLLGEENLEQKKIVWSVSGDCVMIRTFDQEEEFPFSDGVLLTLVKPGEAEVSAELDGCVYRCAVRVREMKTAQPGEPLNEGAEKLIKKQGETK